MSENKGSKTSRPKLQNLEAKTQTKEKAQVIARTAQPGNVLLPRAVFYRTDLQPSERLVAGWLYDHLKPGTNIATGSQETIALETGLSTSTVQRALDGLWAKNIIISVEKNLKLNGYYLSYAMRIFPAEEPRKRSRTSSTKVAETKVIEATTTDNSAQSQASESDTPKIRTPKPSCPHCYGSGWMRLADRKGVQRCECKFI